MIYRSLVRPLFFRLESETAHHLVFDALRFAMAVPGLGPLTERLLMPRDPALEVRALGLSLIHI